MERPGMKRARLLWEKIALHQVDAPLDEPNIERLARLVHQMSGQTQCIAITLAKTAVDEVWAADGAAGDAGSGDGDGGELVGAIAHATRDTEIFTRYPNAPRSRISRSLDTLSRFPFRMDVTRVREEPARCATSAWVRASTRTICRSRFRRACCTCHS
jgi:hypothetical protein